MHIDRAKALGSADYTLPIRALEQIYFHLACKEQFFQRERVIDGKLHMRLSLRLFRTERLLVWIQLTFELMTELLRVEAVVVPA